MSERTVEAGSHCTLNLCADKRWTESDALDPTFEKPQKAQVVRIKIEAVSLHSTSMAPSLDGPLLADRGPSGLASPSTATGAKEKPQSRSRGLEGRARAACNHALCGHEQLTQRGGGGLSIGRMA